MSGKDPVQGLYTPVDGSDQVSYPIVTVRRDRNAVLSREETAKRI